MRIAVISDIHSNVEPLKKIVSEINKNNVDMIINLGDIISKGKDHRECIDYLLASNIKSIKGNSELYLLNGVDIDEDVLSQREHFDEINKSLDDNHLMYLKSLPMELVLNINGKKLYFSHFMFDDINASYPYYNLSSVRDGSFYKALKDFSKNYDLLVFGHAHIKIIMDNALIVPSVGLSELEYLLIDIEDDLKYEFLKVGK